MICALVEIAGIITRKITCRVIERQIALQHNRLAQDFLLE